MILSISEHIYKVLNATTALTEKVGDRIYPLGTKFEVAFPFVIYERDNVDIEYDKASRRTANVDVSIFAVAETYTDSLAIAEIISDALDKVEAHYDGFDVVDAHIYSASEDFVENSFVQRVNFRFQITENNE